MKNLEKIFNRTILGIIIAGSVYLSSSCALSPAVVQFGQAVATACAVEYGVGNREYEHCLLKNKHPFYGK